MSAMASQNTSLTIVYATVYPGADQRKHQSSTTLAFVGNSLETGEFHAQRASNAGKVSIWLCHHVMVKSKPVSWIYYTNKSAFFSGDYEG